MSKKLESMIPVAEIDYFKRAVEKTRLEKKRIYGGKKSDKF